MCVFKWKISKEKIYIHIYPSHPCSQSWLPDGLNNLNAAYHINSDLYLNLNIYIYILYIVPAPWSYILIHWVHMWIEIIQTIVRCIKKNNYRHPIIPQLLKSQRLWCRYPCFILTFPDHTMCFFSASASRQQESWKHTVLKNLVETCRLQHLPVGDWNLWISYG